MPGLAVTPQFMCRPPGFRLVLPWVRWLTPPAGIFRPPGCTIAGLVWNNEPRGGGEVAEGRMRGPLLVEQLSQLFRNNWDNCSTLPSSSTVPSSPPTPNYVWQNVRRAQPSRCCDKVSVKKSSARCGLRMIPSS